MPYYYLQTYRYLQANEYNIQQKNPFIFISAYQNQKDWYFLLKDYQ